MGVAMEWAIAAVIHVIIGTGCYFVGVNRGRAIGHRDGYSAAINEFANRNWKAAGEVENIKWGPPQNVGKIQLDFEEEPR